MTEKKYNHILMDRANLEKLSKEELINLVLNKEEIIKKSAPKMIRKQIQTPRKSVRDMIQQYEGNIISPPPEFRDEPIPITPPPEFRDKPILISPPPDFRDKPIPKPRSQKIATKVKPVPEKRTIISQVEKALKGFTQSFDVELRNKIDPLSQLQKSRKAIEYLFNNLLIQTKGFKFVETLQVKFIKYSNAKNIMKNGYFNSKADLITNETDIKLAIETSQQQILNKIAQWISEGSGWTILSIENHYIKHSQLQPIERIILHQITTRTAEQC